MLYIGADIVLNSYFGHFHGPMFIFESNCEPTDRSFNQCQVDYFPYSHEGCNQYHDIAGVRCEGTININLIIII